MNLTKRGRHRINPAKLLLSKWTAVNPDNSEKHFIVTRLVPAEEEGAVIDEVEIEAVYSHRSEVIAWRTLQDRSNWIQGWH